MFATQDLTLDGDDAGAQEEHDKDAWIDEDNEEDDSARALQLHPCDLDNFFKLCSALKIFLAETINEAQLSCADTLIREYCTELIEVRQRCQCVLFVKR